MTKELAKLLATALVEFIYKDKPSETLHHLDTERMVFMTCLKDGAFDTLNSMIQSKLSGLTEFESSLRQVLVEALSGEMPTGSSGSMSWAVIISDDEIKKLAPKILNLAREQLIKDGYVIEKKAFHDAVEKVSPEVMKEVSGNVDKMEEELTEFEKFMDKVVDDAIRETYSKDGFYDICRDALALAKKELARRDEVITLNNLPPYDKGFQDGKAEAMADLERTFECNPDKLPKWLKNALLQKYLVGYDKGREEERRYGSQKPMCWEPGRLCTNPMRDCINCPRMSTMEMYNTTCGASAATLHGNTSATDGKEHNPSFTD